MNKSALLLGLVAGLLFAAGTANAGACGTEIEALQRTIGRIATDAYGPYANYNANIEAATDAEGHTDTGTPGGTVPAPSEIFMPPVNAGRTITGGSEPVSAPSGKSGLPAETQLSNSNAAEDRRLNMSVANPDLASQALVRAQVLNQAGDEAGCMNEVRQAKNQLRVR